MSNFLKLTVLFFAIVLSISTGTDSYGEALKVKHNSLAEGPSSSYFSDSKLNPFCLFRTGERFSSPVNNFTGPDFKSSSYGNWVESAFELKLINVASQYLLLSKVILPGLSIRDIIFPFHSFL